MHKDSFNIDFDMNGDVQPLQLDEIGSEDEFEPLSDLDWVDDDELFGEESHYQHNNNEKTTSSYKPQQPGSSKLLDERKKRRKAKRRRGGISADDIRLRYLEDHVAAINSADSDHLWSLLESRYTPDCLHIERYLDAVSDSDICMYREMHGLDQIHKFISAAWEAVPDITMKLLTRRLHIRSNERSYLVGAVQFTGSWIYKINTQNYEKESKHLLSRYNPFTRLYNFIIGDATPPRKQQQQEQQTEYHAMNSGSADIFPKFTRGKANPALTTIKVSADSIKVSTAQTAFDTSAKKDRPVKLEIFYTMIMFLNEDKMVYRFEHIKRAKTTTLDLQAYLSGTFEDEDIAGWKV